MKNKKVLIIVLISILLILIVLTGTALAYINTDLFKTNKQLFFKYVSQIKEIENNFKDEELIAYYEKQKIKPYETVGKITAKVSIPEYEEQLKSVLKSVNDVNIVINGKNDEINKKQDYKVNLNYSDEVTFPIEFRRDKDLYALTSNIVVNKFVAVENNNLKEFFSKCGVNYVGNIPNKIEPKETISREEIDNILENYKIILENNLKDDNFSKMDNDKIVLTLKKYELKNILIEMLEELENTNILNNKKDVQELINKLKQANDSQDEALKVIVYKNNGRLTKIEVKIEEVVISITIENSRILLNLNVPEQQDISIIIEKIEQQNVLNYQITFLVKGDNGSSETYFKTEFSDITSENVKEKYIFGLKTNNKEEKDKELLYEYTLDTQKAFVDTITIEGLTNENSVVLNNWEEEQIKNLLTGIGNRILEINEQQMQMLGTKQNPLIMATPVGYIYNEFTSKVVKNTYKNNQQFQEAMKTEQQQLQEMEKKASNLELEQYAGDKVTGSTVKNLLRKIYTNMINQNNSNSIKSIVYNNQEIEANTDNITNIQKEILTARYYKVSLEYNDTTKLIEKVIIQQSN